MTRSSRYTVRGFAGSSDLAGMVAVRNARADADRSEDHTTVEDMASAYEHLQRCDPDLDIRIVEDGGEIVGYARTVWDDVTEGYRVFWVIAEAHPDHPGLEESLFEWGEDRARAVASGMDAADVRFASWADESTPRARLLRRRGYEPIRFGATLVRPHLRDIPSRPLPDDLEVRPVGEDDLRAVWEADVEAFRDHRGFVEPTEEDWKAFLDQPYFDPSLWRVAWAGDEIAGQVRSFIDTDYNRRFGRRRGWIEYISTRRPWRGRGVASALISLSLAAVRDRGMTEAALGVDTENPSGAFRLYRNLGFEEDRLHGEYEKPLR